MYTIFNGYISKSTLRARYGLAEPFVHLSVLPQYFVGSCEIYQSFMPGSSLFNSMNMKMSRYEFFKPAMLYMFPSFFLVSHTLRIQLQIKM